jgi:uncharacterized protein
MWTIIASFILRNRVIILVVLAVMTGFMAWQATHVKVGYKFGGLLPKDDSTYIAYQKFIEQFSEDGNVLVIGVNDSSLFHIENFEKWVALGKDLKAVQVPKTRTNPDGTIETYSVSAVDSVFSLARCYNIVKDTAEKRFRFEPIMKVEPSTQLELDQALSEVRNLPFYEGILYKKGNAATLMTVFVNAELFNSADRGESVEQIAAMVDNFEEATGIRPYISGLPFIRTEMTTKVKQELLFFVLLAALVTALLLLLFFRNIGVVTVCMIVVSVGVIWSLGTIALFDYSISMLMGLIPPLMIVIGVPNCIYLLNKYHSEFKKHGNKAKSLTRVIQKVGNATFMTNATTAMGFATFIFTKSNLLKQFGVVASINILVIFAISILTIPTIFSFLPSPKRKHVRHLDRKWVFLMVTHLVRIVQDHRRTVYVSTIIIGVVGLWGLSLVKTTGNIVGDFPSHSRVIKDLSFFESNFNGIMPFEVLVDVKRPGQITKEENLRKIEELQNLLKQYPQFSKSLSIVDATKFARQAFYEGDSTRYALIRNNERSFIGPYFQNDYNTGGIENTFLDTAKSMTRITAQIADIGTDTMGVLMRDLKPRIENILNPERPEVDSLLAAFITSPSKEGKTEAANILFDGRSRMKRDVAKMLVEDGVFTQEAYDENREIVLEFVDHPKFVPNLKKAVEAQFFDVIITGTSIVFLEGTNYMVKNLLISLMIAIFVIAVIMSLLFRSMRMVLISLLPNLFPLIVTGAIMGFCGIPLKPSTILVFSIAFGISVDDTIHFLAKYRQELKLLRWNIRESVLLAVKETGVSMMYTSVVLFFGFAIFAASEFDGTRALGILVSVTLLVAMLANLLLLPSLLLSFQKYITTKAFSEPFMEIIDEEEDIELEELQVRRGV